MSNTSDSFTFSINVQLLLTVFLVVLLWSIYSRFRKIEFFRWWAWAWTCFAFYLAVAALSLSLGPAWTPLKITLIFLLAIAGFLEPGLLVFGGLSWSRPHRRPTYNLLWKTLGLVALAGITCFLLGYLWRQDGLISFLLRNLPRTVALTAALLFSCLVFANQAIRSRSWAAGVTALFCLFYAVDQAFYSFQFAQLLAERFSIPTGGVLRRLATIETVFPAKLLFLDLVNTCGICLGMILLLVERYQCAQRELETSERLRVDLAVDNSALQAEIAQRQRAEEALRLSQAKFASAFHANPCAMSIASLPDGRFVEVNESFLRQVGYGRDEVLGRTTRELGLCADNAKFSSIFSDTGSQRRVVGKEVRVRTKSGRVLIALCSAEVFQVGPDLFALTASEDITARRAAETALRESEARFRTVADTAACGMWIIQNNRLVYINREVEAITGYSGDEILAMAPWELVEPEFRPALQARAKPARSGGGILSRFQYKIRTKNGELRWLELSDSAIDYEGHPAVLVTAFDITPAKRAEQELREHTLSSESLISNSPLGIVTKDVNNRVLSCNPAFERMFLYTQAEIQGQHLDDVIASNDSQEAARLTRSVETGGVVHATAHRRRKDGMLLDVELHNVRIFSAGTFVGAFAIYQDITERRRSEEKLQFLRSRLARAQEEERARIARDLHDDTGQRLALLNVELEQMKQASSGLQSSLTEQLESLAKAASEITSDVHSLSRRLHPSQVELLGLAKALNNFCREYAEHNFMEIQFVNAGLNSRPPHDVALCLFRVAQEAVRNAHRHSRSHHACVELKETPGCLRLSISDQGAGFDPDSPQATQGLGLLSMAERLKSMGGELSIQSRPGRGTRIEASIPLPAAVGAYSRHLLTK